MQIETQGLIHQADISYGKIYRLTNKINGKMYHGQTTEVDINNRWKHYKRLYCKNQPKLYNALKAHGPENFLFEVIDTSAQDLSQLNALETLYIRKYDSMHNGYNCNEGGAGRGRVCDETRRNMSIAFTGRKLSPETRKKMSESRKDLKNPNFGKHHSIETKNKISKAKLGQQGLCGETNPMFGKRGNKNPNFGKHHSVETKLKISNARKGQKMSAEHKRKLSEAHKGHITSNEHRINLSKALKGHKLSEETKRKISESHKNRYINVYDL